MNLATDRYFARRYYAGRYAGARSESASAPIISIYTPKHASALAKLRAKGQRITFTKTERARDAAGNLGGPQRTVVSGYALGLEKGDPKTYEKLGLTFSAAPSIMVVCDTYGQVPPDLAECTWGGHPHTVRDVHPFAPDGVGIFFTVVVAR